MEVWKKIEGFENYEVSNYGNVKRNNKLRTIKPNKRGYVRIDLYNKGVFKYFFIHRLVANSFLDNTKNKPQVNHINGIKHDNRVENLEWCTAKENIIHAINNNLIIPPAGEKQGASKLTEADILNIRKDTTTKKYILAEKYNVSRGLISDIINFKRWKHL